MILIWYVLFVSENLAEEALSRSLSRGHASGVETGTPADDVPLVEGSLAPPDRPALGWMAFPFLPRLPLILLRATDVTCRYSGDVCVGCALFVGVGKQTKRGGTIYFCLFDRIFEDCVVYSTSLLFYILVLEVGVLLLPVLVRI